MTSIFADGALHPGRDAADSWWIPIRQPEDWDGAVFDGVALDPSRGVVELAPEALAAGDVDGGIVGPDGTVYRSDSRGDRVLWQRPCDPPPWPVPGIGGTGWETGRFRSPAGLALDHRGWLYVADRGNHRVQVIELDERGAARVVIVLGAVDPFGRPAPGDGRAQMNEPVAVAVSATDVYVAEAAGRIVVFDRGFGFRHAFEVAVSGAGAAVEILGIAIDEEGALLVAVAGWSRLLRFSCAGRMLGEVDVESGPPVFAGLAGRTRFASEGTVVLGPLDGGVDRMAWHEIAVDAILPAGTAVEIQTFAADPASSLPGTTPAPPPLSAAVPWAPAHPVAMPVPRLETGPGELARPVLSDTSVWERWQDAPYLRGHAVYQFAGEGPNAAGSMELPAAAARVLRPSDVLELRGPAATESGRVLAISPRTVTAEVSGPGFVLYSAGATLTLRERDGRRVDAEIHTLAPGELVSVGAFTADGEVGDVSLPHAIAALLREGDLVELAAPAPSPDRARLRIDSIDPAAAVVHFTLPLAGDHRESAVELVESAGRLVVRDAEGWGEGFPPGDVVEIAWDDAGTIRQVVLTVRWSDPATATVWTAAPAPATWLSLQPGTPAVATDRGRYLWVRLRLRGARRRATDALAFATPTVRGLRCLAPRPPYLSRLPALFSRRDDGDPTGALFLERYLALFETRLTEVEDHYEAVARMLNPLAADDSWLEFVAAWFDLALDPSWSRERRARLVAEIFSLYRQRGTAAGIRRAVELYTGHEPALIEGFQTRPRAGLVLGCRGVVGCSVLDEDGRDAHAHRFTLVAYADDDCDLAVADGVIRAIVDAVKPAHTEVDVRVAVPQSRIGVSTTVGLDFLLGDERATAAPLGTRAAAPPAPAPVLGVDAVLDGSPPAPRDTIGDVTLR